MAPLDTTRTQAIGEVATMLRPGLRSQVTLDGSPVTDRADPDPRPESCAGPGIERSCVADRGAINFRSLVERRLDPKKAHSLAKGCAELLASATSRPRLSAPAHDEANRVDVRQVGPPASPYEKLG